MYEEAVNPESAKDSGRYPVLGIVFVSEHINRCLSRRRKFMISRGTSYGGQFSRQRHNDRGAIRRAIQNSQASLRELAARYSINPQTVAKWRRRGSV